MPQKKSLKSLEARMDAQLRDFGYGPVGDEEQRGTSLPRMAVRGAAAGAGVAGLGAAVMNRKKIAQGVGSGMEKAGGYMRNQGVLTKNIKAGRVMGDIGKKIISGGKKLQGFESVGEIIELAERVAELELEEEREFADAEKQRNPVGIYLTGGPVGLYDRAKYKESGLAYRKRDALKDGMKGGMAGTAAGYGAAGAVLGGAAGLGALAAKGKLPKGMLRKVGAKAGSAFRNGSPGLVAGAIGAGSLASIGTSIKVQHGSAEKRRKALLMQRLQGGEG